MPMSRVEGFPFRPMLDFIYVVEFGQPVVSQGGIYLGDSSEHHWRYRVDEIRYGEVVALGPGRWGKSMSSQRKRDPMPDLVLGDIVGFSRKSGTRLPKNRRFASPRFPTVGELNIRVLDPTKIVFIHADFQPWWNIGESLQDPDGMMTG
jgi:co-chaperonin GroES (HSP10)